jgi:hypothetical protein
MHPIVKMIKNTHSDPVNRAFHLVGLPLYGIGLFMALGHYVGLQTDLAMGISMWLAAIAMFVCGHLIEGNIWSITPVLLFRLISKIAHNFVLKKLQIFPT